MEPLDSIFQDASFGMHAYGVQELLQNLCAWRTSTSLVVQAIVSVILTVRRTEYNIGI